MLPPSITGDVVEVHARWTAGGDRIITESSVVAADGTVVVVSQLGGTVDGVTMRQMPGPAILEAGMTVQLAVHEAPDLSATVHAVVDDVAILARPAQPDFVRTGPTKAGNYLYWESGCIFLVADPAGTKAVPPAMVAPVITSSIATWNTDTSSCSYIQVMQQDAPSGATTLEVGNDGMNILKFRDASWCRPAVDDDPARCYSDAAAGITTAVYIDDATSARDGAILDADIEINGVDFAISVDGVTASDQACLAELQNTLTHELGHLHGLEHTCVVPTDPARFDNNGSAVPACADTTDPEIVNATMYPFQDCGETTKETLEDDDIDGVCTVYPTANDPNTCVGPVSAKSGGGCNAGGGGGGGGGGAFATLGAVLGALVLVRRRRRGARDAS